MQNLTSSLARALVAASVVCVCVCGRVAVCVCDRGCAPLLAYYHAYHGYGYGYTYMT